MKVKELIEILQHCPQDDVVTVCEWTPYINVFLLGETYITIMDEAVHEVIVGDNQEGFVIVLD